MYLLFFPRYAEFNDKINQRGTYIHKFEFSVFWALAEDSINND